VVELTVALHYIFNFEQDKLVWDVGHQAYIHKLLTERKDQFESIRRLNGLSGFPKIDESIYDHFGTGHSSTSISAILGMAEASLLDQRNKKHIAVIGDGSLSGGMAFEALNNLGMSKANVLVIVNDNEMGIDPNLGAINQHLAKINNSSSNFFENLNIDYSGPIDGHDLDALTSFFIKNKKVTKPQVLHIKTVKGKGHEAAEKEQTQWHSVSYVKIDPLKPETRDVKPLKFQDVFGYTLVELAKQDARVVGITPAMPSGSSMKYLMDEMPERVFDVGIAEQHAVTFSAGLALEGKRPFCNIYSSFAQRAFDQIIHDVALQNIPVVFCLDRAGLVGEDGPTHHGVFDLAFLNCIPNLTVVSPMDEHELRNAMYWAKDYTDGPVVIRYPRGRGTKINYQNPITSIEIGKSRMIIEGNELAILSIGAIGTEVQKALNRGGFKDVTHIDARFMKPLDTQLYVEAFRRHRRIITVEDGCLKGGFGESIKVLALDIKFSGSITSLGLPDEFIPHGEIHELREKYGINSDGIEKVIRTLT
jgi:1-deoxy-D-xylulose-5-phosphate synthase